MCVYQTQGDLRCRTPGAGDACCLHCCWYRICELQQRETSFGCVPLQKKKKQTALSPISRCVSLPRFTALPKHLVNLIIYLLFYLTSINDAIYMYYILIKWLERYNIKLNKAIFKSFIYLYLFVCMQWCSRSV